MKTDPSIAAVALDRRFLLDFPQRAAQRLESMDLDEAADVLGAHPATVLAPVIVQLALDVAARLITRLPDDSAVELLAELAANDAARLLSALEDDERERYLSALEGPVARDVSRMLAYAPDSAGRLMETHVTCFRGSATVEEALNRLRRARARATRSLFIVDEDNKLSGRVRIQELAVAEPETSLDELAEPVAAVASPVTPREQIVEMLDRHKLADLAVVDNDGHLLGIIYHGTLIQAMQEEATADIQTMVGASSEERALSKAAFAIRKRLPWLQINLLTAFLAASVVGLFEETIARFTALAVLLPVVAGQSGNAGAQALAVTMRGLALHEIGLRDWLKVTVKEVQAGFINGLAVALTCGIGVFIWSGSIGLVIVIAASMVLAMVAAGFAGAIIPISLTRLGQDPATSSSIILTTVTDVAGFLSFLGIATLLAAML